MLRIVVDDRESPSGIPALLREQDGVQVEVRRLPLGDYLIGDRVVSARQLAETTLQGPVAGDGNRPRHTPGDCTS